MLKILFVIKEVEYIDPMGIMLLSALAKQKGHKTAIAVLSEGKLEKTVRDFSPDVAAFSAKTGEHKYYITANNIIKKTSPKTFTVIGGPHATFFPEIIEKYPFDALCVGEGDDAWPELLEAVEKGSCIEDIPNIVTKKNYSRGARPVIRPKRKSLDNLPFLDRDLLYSSTRLARFPMRSFMIGRGCPYKCTYCFNRKYNLLYKGRGALYQRMSVGRVIAELKDLKSRYETQFIKFYDDIFVMKDDEWLDEFSERYPREVGVPFHCLMRANLLTEPILLKLKKAGVKSLTMSIESGSDFVRNSILNRNISKEALTAAFDLCARHGIPTFSNTIFGIPGTTLNEDIESLDMNLRCKVTFGEFPLFFPYPGTELSDYSIKNGYFDGDFDRLHMSYQACSPLRCYTEKQKMMQMNLSLLSTFCLLFPSTRDLIVKRFIKYPFTRLYFLLYYLSKAYLIKKKIYPLRLSVMSTVMDAFYSYTLEKFKHLEETFAKEAPR